MMGAELLQDYVRRRAQARPESRAVVLGDEWFSYGGLEATSNRLAWLLADLGCQRGDRVALLAPKSPAAVAALLGIYKAGATFVPLDTASPPARLARILRSCDSRCVIGGAGTARRLAELRRLGALGPGVSLGWMGPPAEIAAEEPSPDFTWDDLDASRAEPPPAIGTGDDVAHILYTSGSTGEPKGVMVRHSSVIRFVEWAVRHFGIVDDDRVSCHPPLPFDLSTFDLFGAFAAGAEVHLVPPEMTLLPHRLVEMIRRSRLTQWLSVPSVLSYIASFDLVQPHDFPALRRLIWSGEVFPTPALVYWMRRLPHVGFTNLYGPTETTIASSYYDVPECPEDERVPVPIGRPCDGEELLILDPGLKPLAEGQVGELYIRGVGLSPGYWRDPERTSAAFLVRPNGGEPDRIYRTGDLAWVDGHGLVHLVGRADSQIKSRGYRIELGEIESALAATGLAQEAVVTAIPTGGFEGHSICCAYVPTPGSGASPAVLKRELGQLLPSYMIPARWSSCDRLPRNANGKLDRRAVQESFAAEARPAELALAAAPGRLAKEALR